MANIQNLRPIHLTHEEATENGRKGGVASGASRRWKKSAREFLQDFLSRDVPSDLQEKLALLGVPEEYRTNEAALLIGVFRKAIRDGDPEAANAVLGWAGLLPLQQEHEAAEIARLKQSTTSEGAVLSDDTEPNDVIIYRV